MKALQVTGVNIPGMSAQQAAAVPLQVGVVPLNDTAYTMTSILPIMIEFMLVMMIMKMMMGTMSEMGGVGGSSRGIRY